MAVIKGFSVEDVLRGYIVCALWAENDESTPAGGVPLDDNYSEDDLAPETRDTLQADVEAFLNAASESDLDTYRETKHIDPSQGTVGDYLGHDLWLSRNGHGAGFFDRDEVPEDVRDRLQDLARDQGGRNIYVGADKQLYIL